MGPTDRPVAADLGVDEPTVLRWQTRFIERRPDGLSDEPRVGPPPSVLRDKLTRRGVHTSVQALEADIWTWIDTWHQNPRPFTWIKTADEILHSLADYLAKITPSNATNKEEVDTETLAQGASSVRRA